MRLVEELLKENATEFKLPIHDRSSSFNGAFDLETLNERIVNEGKGIINIFSEDVMQKIQQWISVVLLDYHTDAMYGSSHNPRCYLLAFKKKELLEQE